MFLIANFLIVKQVDVVSHFQWTLSLNTTVSSRNHIVESTGWFLQLMLVLALKVCAKFEIRSTCSTTRILVMLLTANFLDVEQVDVVSHFQWTLSLNTIVSARNHI